MGPSVTGMENRLTPTMRASFYMGTTDQPHWDSVYRTKPAESVSWFQPVPTLSLTALNELGATPGQSLIDVGGGASRLVDALLDRDWSDLAVLDIAGSGLDEAKRRLADRAAQVEWIVADITDWEPLRTYDFWHDRAVFHFLNDPAQRSAYLRAMDQALAAGGASIMATFALDGPERCSGLPVQRYDEQRLAEEVGPSFQVVRSWREEHVTPNGSRQAFTWCAFRKS